MRDRLPGPLIASATEELRQLILERLLDDQPRAEPTDLLDRIPKLASVPDQRIELLAQPLARGYSRSHLGVPPACLAGQSGGYARIHFSPATGTSPSIRASRSSGMEIKTFAAKTQHIRWRSWARVLRCVARKPGGL